METKGYYKEARESCRISYLAGRTDVEQLAREFGVKPRTVQTWIVKGRWADERADISDLESQIEQETVLAYLTALREYRKNPQDSNIQSLVALMRAHRDEKTPNREYLDYIVKFLDQLSEYMIEKGLTNLHKLYKPIVMDVAEWLRVRNG